MSDSRNPGLDGGDLERKSPEQTAATPSFEEILAARRAAAGLNDSLIGSAIGSSSLGDSFFAAGNYFQPAQGQPTESDQPKVSKPNPVAATTSVQGSTTSALSSLAAAIARGQAQLGSMQGAQPSFGRQAKNPMEDSFLDDRDRAIIAADIARAEEERQKLEREKQAREAEKTEAAANIADAKGKLAAFLGARAKAGSPAPKPVVAVQGQFEQSSVSSSSNASNSLASLPLPSPILEWGANVSGELSSVAPIPPSSPAALVVAEKGKAKADFPEAEQAASEQAQKKQEQDDEAYARQLQAEFDREAAPLVSPSPAVVGASPSGVYDIPLPFTANDLQLLRQQAAELEREIIPGLAASASGSESEEDSESDESEAEQVQKDQVPGDEASILQMLRQQAAELEREDREIMARLAASASGSESEEDSESDESGAEQARKNQVQGVEASVVQLLPQQATELDREIIPGLAASASGSESEEDSDSGEYEYEYEYEYDEESISSEEIVKIESKPNAAGVAAVVTTSQVQQQSSRENFLKLRQRFESGNVSGESAVKIETKAQPATASARVAKPTDTLQPAARPVSQATSAKRQPASLLDLINDAKGKLKMTQLPAQRVAAIPEGDADESGSEYEHEGDMSDAETAETVTKPIIANGDASVGANTNTNVNSAPQEQPQERPQEQFEASMRMRNPNARARIMSSSQEAPVSAGIEQQLYRPNVVSESSPAKKPSFLSRHWGKILFGVAGALLVTGIVMLGVVTGGVVPAIAIGVAGLIGVSATTGAVLGLSAIAAACVSVGAVLGTLLGFAVDRSRSKAKDGKLNRSSESVPGFNYGQMGAVLGSQQSGSRADISVGHANQGNAVRSLWSRAALATTSTPVLDQQRDGNLSPRRGR